MKFTPRLFHKIWGGEHIKEWYRPASDSFENVGESWLISAVEKYPTEVANGPHAGDSLQDLLEVYMSELVGDRVYETFGNTFPLLVKFIDAADDLSIQVHPDDDYAWEHVGTMGKTEMWYVMDSEPEASLLLGWKHDTDEAHIREAIHEGDLQDHLHLFPVKRGDVALIEAKTVHAIKKGTVVAEIQENSDTTYRLYDYNRVGNDGKLRPLHLESALEVMDYTANGACRVEHHPAPKNGTTTEVVSLAKTPYFTTNRLSVATSVQRDFAALDSFVIYICTEGELSVKALDCEGDVPSEVTLRKGEAVLIPACLNDIVLLPQSPSELLEVYVEY